MNIIFILAVAVLGGYAVNLFNRLVRLRNQLKNSFHQIDIQLKRRYDLIPNLVETVKASLAHEKETLEDVVKARNQALAAYEGLQHDPTRLAQMGELVAAEGALGAALGRLNVVLESYPDLKANQVTSSLMEELTSTENRIAFSRQAYNDSVMEYNNQCEMFPQNMVASFFGFRAGTVIDFATPEQSATPRVQLR